MVIIMFNMVMITRCLLKPGMFGFQSPRIDGRQLCPSLPRPRAWNQGSGSLYGPNRPG